jgi:uncharacterized protein (TIGR03066 family)
MRWSRCSVAAALVLGLALIGSASPGGGKDKIDARKLVGTWKVSKSEMLPPGSVVQFAKDGKLKVNAEKDGEKVEIKGTYKVDGNKLTVTITVMDTDSKHNETIKKLTDKELIIQHEMGGKTTELTRVK